MFASLLLHFAPRLLYARFTFALVSLHVLFTCASSLLHLPFTLGLEPLLTLSHVVLRPDAGLGRAI